MEYETKYKTYECVYCGDIFIAKLKNGPERDDYPPCIICALSGKQSITPEQRLKMEIEG